MKNFTQKFIGLLALVFSMSTIVNSQEIGDIYQGGMVFQINENGSGLVAAMEDLPGVYQWGGAVTEASSYSSEGYTGWHLPSIDELLEMYNTIGQGSPEGNIGGFEDNYNDLYWYWSSTENALDNTTVWCVGFGDSGYEYANYKDDTRRVRVVRSVTFDDGIGQDEVDAAYADGITSVEIPECEEVTTQNIPLDLPQGWSMFGYTCLDSVDAMVGFSAISDKIEIVKDEWGLSYLPSWDFNAMGSLQFSEGYQIKMMEEILDFSFCSTLILEGCMDEIACNYNPLSNTDDGSCIYAQEGYDCDGEALQIGSQHAGGIVFQINEDGTGLVADIQDLGVMDWWDAMSAAGSYTSEGYSDWYLPSKDELVEMEDTKGNIGGFEYTWYWSSSESGSVGAWAVKFDSGGTATRSKTSSNRVRVIRAF